MKSQTIRIAVSLFAAVLLMSTGAWALSSGRVQVQVPFAFYAADQLLPAGSYVIDSANGGRSIKIQRRDGPDFALVLTMPTAAGKSNGNYLTFHRYGSENFLRLIQSSDVAIQGSLWQTHKEKELAATVAKSNKADKRLAGPVQITIQLKGE
jgi:hypothetical protein